MRPIFWSAGAISGCLVHVPALSVLFVAPPILAFLASSSASCQKIPLDAAALRCTDWTCMFMLLYFANNYAGTTGVITGIALVASLFAFICSLIYQKRAEASTTSPEIDIEQNAAPNVQVRQPTTTEAEAAIQGKSSARLRKLPTTTSQSSTSPVAELTAVSIGPMNSFL